MTSLPILIPQGFNVSVTLDQKVSKGDIIASSVEEEVSQDLEIHIAADLGSDPAKSESLLIKKLGERIEIGDLIAKKGGVFGTKEITSKVSGTIVSFNPEDGSISVRIDGALEESSKKTITSPVDGVVEVCDNDKVVLKTDKEAILAEASSGESSLGEVFYLEKESPDPSDITEKVSGKILIAKNLNRDGVSKAIGLSANGIIGEDISDEVFENLKSKMIKTPVLRVSPENFKKIAKKSGKLMLDSGNSVIIKL